MSFYMRLLCAFVFLWPMFVHEKKTIFMHIIKLITSDAVMGRLCAFSFFRQALFVHEKTIFSSD